MRKAEERLRDQLAGTRKDKRVPIDQRPDASETPICPIDALPLQVVSYDAGGRPAEKKCPACGRSERQFMEKGVDLTPTTTHVKAALAHPGWQKEHVVRKW